MDIKDVINTFTNQPDEKIHWGSAYSLWEVCRHKVIGLPVLELLLSYVQDPELKILLKAGIELNAIPHIEKLQKFMKEHSLTYPPFQARNAIDDEQIGRALIEILRHSLNHEIHAFMSITRDNERDLFWGILSEDKKEFDKIIDLNRKKGWMLNPPNLITNN
jgi:hypothetical protein